MYSMMTFNSISHGSTHMRQQALWPNGLSRMILKAKYLTVGSTIITAIDIHVWTSPIKPNSFLWNCLIYSKSHPLLYLSGKRVRHLRLSLFCYLINFVNDLAELTVITLFALLFVLKNSIYFSSLWDPLQY